MQANRHVRVPAFELLDERLDTGFYSPAYFDARAKLSTAGFDSPPIGRLCEPWQFGAYALCNHIVWSDERHGVPYVKAEALGSPLVNHSGLSYITRQTHEVLKKSKVGPGDIVVSTSGTIGLCAVWPVSLGTGNSNQDTIKFNPKNDEFDNYFVAAWLACRLGQTFLLREAGGGVQQHVYLYNFKRIPLPRPSIRAQRYIGDKVRQAERLQDLSSLIELGLRDTFAPLSHELGESPRAWRTSSRILDSYRANPSHYDPLVVQMLRDAATKAKLMELGSLFGDRGISGGATPLGADYRDSGVFFVRVQNVKPYHLNLSDAAYLSTDQDEQLTRSRCNADDIVFSITGYPGTASLVMEEDLPINLNQHSVRFDIRKPYDSAYIVAAMNSPFVKRQVDRLAIGGTREALDYPSVRSLLIPILDDSVMEKVSKRVRRRNHAERFSQRLVVAARAITEGLIEGKIAEAELIQIQNAIEKGDRSADQDLLRRLTATGIDVPGAPKLFPDLDALYRSLEALETPESEAK